MSIRKALYYILEDTSADAPFSRVQKWVNGFLVVLILANVVSIIAESEEPIYLAYHLPFLYFEFFSVGLFTLEYLLRLWCCVEANPEQAHWRTRLQWMKTPGAIIDLLAIVPILLYAFLPYDLRYLRLLRLERMLKLSRYFVSMRILLAVLNREKSSFGAALLILILMLILAACAIYVLEHEVQPELFGSIPRAMWWAVVTLTTVGYGDATPITNGGRFLGAIITILGIGIAAMPAGILASGLASELTHRREKMEDILREKLRLHGHDELTNKEVRRIQRSLGLSDEQVEQLIDDVMQEHSDTPPSHCPHCGHLLIREHGPPSGEKGRAQ